MRIIKGMQFLCLKDVNMNSIMPGPSPLKYIAYYKGKTYTSEQDGCITNEKGNSGHYWGCEDDPFKECFELVVKPNTNIVKGMRFHCHKTVVFNQFTDLCNVERYEAYIAGNAYISEQDDCITNERGIFSLWPEGTDYPLFKEYFTVLESTQLKEAKEMQAQQLDQWSKKLTYLCYVDLANFIHESNKGATRPEQIKRGTHLTEFIQNWKP